MKETNEGLSTRCHFEVLIIEDIAFEAVTDIIRNGLNDREGRKYFLYLLELRGCGKFKGPLVKDVLQILQNEFDFRYPDPKTQSEDPSECSEFTDCQ